jgi:hypothetical protein
MKRLEGIDLLEETEVALIAILQRLIRLLAPVNLGGALPCVLSQVLET